MSQSSSQTVSQASRVTSYYAYKPSLGGNAIFIVLFSAFTIGHMVKLARTRNYYFMAFIIGGLMQAAGYAIRLYGRSNPTVLGPYVMQSIFLLVSPALFAATIYMILGRIVRFLSAEHLSPIHSTRITKIFVLGDVLSFLTQAGGGGMMGQENDSARNMGRSIILVGLFIQIMFFGGFVVLSSIVHRRLRRSPTRVSQGVNWGTHVMSLYSVSGLIFVRSIFRVIEYVQGFKGWLISHEWTLFVFDGELMAVVMLILLVVHPSRLLESGKTC